MIVQLTRLDGTILDAHIAPPTLAKRDEVRAIGKLQLKEATRLDAKYRNVNPINDDERFEAQADYSNEIQKLLEKQTIELFQTVVNKAQLNDQDKQLFEPGNDNSDFWGAQNLHDMNAALEFFRKNQK